MDIRERTLDSLTDTEVDLLGRLVSLPSLSDTFQISPLVSASTRRSSPRIGSGGLNRQLLVIAAMEMYSPSGDVSPGRNGSPGEGRWDSETTRSDKS